MTAVRSIVLATRNSGKAREFERLLGPMFEVASLPPAVALPEETERTFAANARLKAEAVFQALGGHAAVLADDSGLEVAALGGRPGVWSARFAGEHATDAENVRKLLDELNDTVDREARFVCALCLIVPGKGAEDDQCPVKVEVQGLSEGMIAGAPRGADGFGYDPVFQPIGWALTLAEAHPADKDSVSHRGAAARMLLARLADQEDARGS